jgi:predicted NBD/HSP70 family sugar kinase
MVFELMRLNEAASRAELARIAGLQKSTVSIIAEQLLKNGWIREYNRGVQSRAQESVPGRKPVELSINESLAVIAVDVRPGRTSVAVTDFHGRIVSQESFQTPSKSKDAERRLAKVASTLMQQHPRLAFQGVGVSVSGRVKAENGVVEFFPNLPWKHWELKAHLLSMLDLPVEVRNAADAIVLSERWFGVFRGVQDALVVTVSEGIGVGILTDGRELLGAHGMAGEFGHVVLKPNGFPCGCGKLGCWETLASERSVERAYAKNRKQSCGKEQPEGYTEILARAEKGEAAALKVLEEQYRQIGDGLRLVLPLVPECILFAGDFVVLWKKFGRILSEQVANHAFPMAAPKLLTTEDATTARLRGATALILQAVYREGLRDSIRK